MVVMSTPHEADGRPYVPHAVRMESFGAQRGRPDFCTGAIFPKQIPHAESCQTSAAMIPEDRLIEWHSRPRSPSKARKLSAVCGHKGHNRSLRPLPKSRTCGSASS